MRLAIRASASPGAEPALEGMRGLARTGTRLSGAFEAAFGLSGLARTGTRLSGNLQFLRPISTGVRARGTLAVAGRASTGVRLLGTLADADFGYSRDLVLAKQDDLTAETLTDFVLIGQSIIDGSLASVANGGHAASDLGDDIKFTDPAVVTLSHNLVTYANESGGIFYDLKIPSWATATADVRHRLFYGNAGIEDPIEDPAGCFSRTAAAWEWPSGADFSAHGRDLTPSTGEPPDPPDPPVEPGDPASFIHVYPMAIDTAAPGDIIRPSFNATGENDTNGLGSLAGKVVDWRARVGAQHYFGADKNNNCTFLINAATATTVFCGGRTKETEAAYVNGTWKFTHGNEDYGENTPGIRVEQAPAGMKLQGFYLNGTMDGIIPAPSLGNTEHPVFENICIINCHDDTIQNDGQRLGTYRNGYLQGHVWYSQRPGSASTPASGLVNTFEYCLIHMDRQRYDTDESGNDNGVAGSKRSGKYVSLSERNNTIASGSAQGWAHKWFIKSRTVGSGGQLLAKLTMRNCLLRIDTIPVEGIDNPGIFPTDGTYQNVHVCWLGPAANGTGHGAWPFPQSKATLAAMGITLHDDETDAYNLWTAAKALWFSANGYNATTDDFSWNRL